jgi:diaminopimelate decarboxylase
MGGGSQQFGIDEEALPKVLKQIKRCKSLSFVGLHMHAGSQILSEENISKNIGYLLRYCAKLQKDMDIKIRLINFGGGIGIPYYTRQKRIDLEILSCMIRKEFARANVKKLFPKTRFIIEPGRFLVGESGVYVTKILYKKKSRGKTFLIVDGGLHHNLAAAGLLGEGFKKNRICGVLTKDLDYNKEIVHIAGCLCTPLDILARDIILPKCEPGDYLYIASSGAYGYSASPLMFLSHSMPAEIMV